MRLISQLTSLALQNQRNLRNLEISAQMIGSVTFSEMMNFVKSLKRCSKTLETLSLDFSGCQNFSTQALHCILLNLKSFEFLVHFDLNLTKCEIIRPLPAEKGLHSPYSVNQNLRRLQLHLGFYTYPNLFDFEVLIIQLKDHKVLEAIDLTFPSEAYSLLRLFSSNIKGMKSLRTLKVNFKLLYEIPEMNELMPEFVSALKNLDNLKTLDLRFSEHNISSKLANIILEGIKTLKDLRSLTLNWELNSAISDKNAENLGVCLRGFTELVSLDIGLQGCNITKAGVIAIFKGLENLKKLKYVEFKPSHPVSQSGSWLTNLFKINRYIMPANDLEASFSQISNLSLNFFGFQLSGKELHQIALNLRKMQAISHLSLSLDFLNSEARWRTGFSSIMAVLNELPKLYSLSIGLDNFGNEDLESFFIDIEGMERLRSLSILLHKGEVLDLYTAMRFWEAMRSLWRLKEFTMRLFWQHSFKAESVRYLLLGLGELECLESLTFDLLLSVDYLAVQGYGEVEVVEKKVLKKLKSLKTLRFLRYMDETMIH